LKDGAQFGDNVVRFHARARDEDLYVAYAIVPPQIDRGTPAHRHPEPFLHPGVVRETDTGIVIRGAHSIATSVTMADWLFVSYITPLVPGDEDYAISLVVPVGAAGLRLLPRRPYATLATSVYDYPLSSRFDEIDTTVVFDDVLVPWEHVFVYRSVERVTAQFHESPAHVTANFQSLVRFGVKLELLAGLRLVVAAVVETLVVFRPGSSGEFHPLEIVGEIFSRVDVAHVPLVPVGAGDRDAVGEELAIVRYGGAGKRDRAIGAQRGLVQPELFGHGPAEGSPRGG